MSTEQHEHTEIAPELLIPWSIIIVQEGPYWMAVALERMTCWWADTQEEAFNGLIEALYWQVEADRGCGQVPFSLVPRAKERDWDLYRSATSSGKFQMPSPLAGEIRVAA